MPRLTFSDFVYAAGHPRQALRYCLHRDRIGYDVCRRFLPDDPVIVEAGAYDGTNTREFCRAWPGCRVYAFEPVPAAYAKLLAVAGEFPDRVHPSALALGVKNETAGMHVSTTGPSGGEQSSSLLAPAATRAEFPHVDFHGEKIPVAVTRLDDWAARQGIERIDFLWLDLQGMELAALEGAGRLLDKVGAIHCEVQNVALYEGAPLYAELRRWLEERGFRVSYEAVFRRGGNVLFTRKSPRRR